MYSYEDLIRAFKLYIKLGKRLGATIRQLGYLSKPIDVDTFAASVLAFLPAR